MGIKDEIHKPQMMAVIPTDVQCMIGILASDLKKVAQAMGMCTNIGPIVSEEERIAWDYFTGPFYEFIDEALKDLEGDGSNSQ